MTCKAGISLSIIISDHIVIRIVKITHMEKLLKFNYDVIMHKYSSYLFSVDDRPLVLPSHRSEMWSVQ